LDLCKGLEAENVRLKNKLRELGWCDNAGNLGMYCPECHGRKPGSGLSEDLDSGHHLGCSLAELLK
jgi:hypothetical protein